MRGKSEDVDEALGLGYNHVGEKDLKEMNRGVAMVLGTSSCWKEGKCNGTDLNLVVRRDAGCVVRIAYVVHRKQPLRIAYYARRKVCVLSGLPIAREEVQVVQAHIG